MNEVTPPPLPEPQTPNQAKVLRQLFLTLFLRGRGARGLNKKAAPRTIASKLSLTLIFYALIGGMALMFLRQPVFALSVYLHAMTFAFLGMFIAASAGEILFNKEEGDILMHRPVSPKVMLWAKIRVLVEVSLWLGVAFNLIGLLVGFFSGGWRFPIVHLFSTTLSALFCTGCVVLVYQLCLRWFGIERLEGLMTAAQVVVSVGAVLAGQVLPRLVMYFDTVLKVDESSWWIYLLPPAWFAGFDDTLAGSASRTSCVLAAMAIAITSLVLWLAFSKLAGDYQAGLQALNETVSSRIKKPNHRPLLDRLVGLPPLSWWLRDQVERASFLLSAAYLIRDRDVKLRLYPSLAPTLILPFVFLMQDHHRHGGYSNGFGICLAGVFLSMVPLTGLQILQYSQQWQAADIFHAAPLAGPARLIHGARRAVMLFIAFPMILLMGPVVWLLSGTLYNLILMLPGIIAMPVFALVPSIGGRGMPLSMPAEAAKSAGRGLHMILVMMISFALAGLAYFSWSQGWFWYLVIGESILAATLYCVMRNSLARVRWSFIE